MSELFASLPSKTRSWNVVMSASPGEMDHTIRASDVDGKIPSLLLGGRMLSNGPGWTRIGNRTAHPFDGHGYLRSFSFQSDGSCHLRARFVETPSYLDEVKAGHLVRRGLATNPSPQFWQNIGFGPTRNVANTTVTRWGDRILAGWEGGAPYALDAESLATRGEEVFGGAIKDKVTLAHMKHDHALNRLVLCSVKPGRFTTLTFREIDTNDQVVSERETQIRGMLFTHDYAISPNWYIVGGNPLRVKPLELAKMLMGMSTMLRSVGTHQGKPGVIHLASRNSNEPVRTVTLPDKVFVVHFGNAFERDGAVVVDACIFHHFDFGEEFGYTGPNTPFDPALPDIRGPQRLYRITIPDGATEATWEQLTPYGVDFPRFHPDHEGVETPALFGATRADTRYSDPFDSIVRVDLLDAEKPSELWTAPKDVFVGEPIFVPDPAAPSKGNILALLSDGIKQKTTLAVFDASALSKGPVATLPMPLLPVAFHGDWDSLS